MTNFKNTGPIDRDNKQVGTKSNPKPSPEPNIGIDISNEFWDFMINASDSSQLDMGSIDSFSQMSQNRETLYDVLDTMGEDSIVAAALETYTEDATETNDAGQTLWAESTDPNISHYITFLLNSLNIEKHIFRWVYSFIKYGDIYLRLYRESDFKLDILNESQKTSLNEQFTNLNDSKVEKEKLDEAAKMIVYGNQDKFANYVEIVSNPAEMFELTKFGKSYAYIKTSNYTSSVKDSTQYLQHIYKFKKKDVEIYNAVSFVHGTLQDDVSRTPEQVEIYLDNNNESDDSTYNVRRGQSILYGVYKVWRNMMLLENALMLNRLTKSSLIRIVELEVGNIPKEKVGPSLQRVKQLIEQKTAFENNMKMSEYTSAGASENTIYLPTNNGKGSVSIQQLGGDVNVRDIVDVDYFRNKFFAALKIPKQFMGETDDSTGFNGGTSLSIISSRYAKTIKRIQAAFIQMITDAINILLIDKGLDFYVNKFTLKMQPPVTQEELDKKNNTSLAVNIASDVLNIIASNSDNVKLLEIAKSLLATSVPNQDVIKLLQEYINQLKEEQYQDKKQEQNRDKEQTEKEEQTSDIDISIDNNRPKRPLTKGPDIDNEDDSDINLDVETQADTLPTPSDLDIGDLTEV